jgi:hypothetical protein
MDATQGYLPENGTVRRTLISWTIGFALLILAFFGTVALLNSTIYSAHGFVSSYLDALNRHDATTARELPGVRAPSGAATNLLTDESLGTIGDIRLVSDTAGLSGVHRVVVSYTLGTRKESTTFGVEQTSSYLGLFSRWEFSTSPLATVSVLPANDPRFSVNGTEIRATGKAATSQSYVVFAPGLYVFSHKSVYLKASPVDIPVSEPGGVTPVKVEAEPNSLFVNEVSKELDKYYIACATQKVMYPTDCPFGKTFANRVVSTPAWSITKDPPVTIIPNDGSWLVPNATGQAHLVVKVQSLFDGSISTFDADVPFAVAYKVTIGAAEHLTITGLYTG